MPFSAPRLTRSRVRIGATAGFAVAVLTLAGCSTTTEATTPAADATGAAAQTVTVEDYFGEVDVAQRPRS